MRSFDFAFSTGLGVSAPIEFPSFFLEVETAPSRTSFVIFCWFFLCGRNVDFSRRSGFSRSAWDLLFLLSFGLKLVFRLGPSSDDRRRGRSLFRALVAGGIFGASVN